MYHMKPDDFPTKLAVDLDDLTIRKGLVLGWWAENEQGHYEITPSGIQHLVEHFNKVTKVCPKCDQPFLPHNGDYICWGCRFTQA